MCVIKKIADKVRNSKLAKGLCAAGAAVATGAASSMTALAANLDEGTKTALTTAFEGVKQDVLDIIAVALPAALVIMGLGIAIKLGIKFFKRFSNG